MNVKVINGKKTAVINIFIDPERGFMDLGLTENQGGVLYVPGGEAVTPVMGAMISGSRNTVFILGQDYHPANHISFMVNHPGVMEYRVEKFKKFLEANGQPAETDPVALYARAQQPVHFFNGFDQPPVPFPFEEIVLDEQRNIIGLKEQDGRIRKVGVETSSGLEPSEEDRGRVMKVEKGYLAKTFDQYRAEGRLLSTQTLWTRHCVQGTDSCLYPADMNLPKGLQEKLTGDLMSNVIYHRDRETGNEFYVVRKGGNSEVDSYGIGMENDKKTLTKAPQVFQRLAAEFDRQGCEQVIINIGGLATNFCVEFSANNVADLLAGYLKMAGMEVKINYVPEISRGIPIPGGADVPFSLEGAPERMQRSRGIGATTVAEIMEMTSDEPKAAKTARQSFKR